MDAMKGLDIIDERDQRRRFLAEAVNDQPYARLGEMLIQGPQEGSPGDQIAYAADMNSRDLADRAGL